MTWRKRFRPVIFRDVDQTRMSLGEHLEELRSRLIKALIGVALAAAVCFYFGDHIFQFLCLPLARAMARTGTSAGLVNLRPHEAFTTYVKISVVCGIVFSSPYWLYQLWAFVAAGLHGHERRWVHLYAPSSLLLFAAGVLFLFYAVLPVTLYFFLYFQQRYIPKPQLQAQPSPSTTTMQADVETQPAGRLPETVPVLTIDPPSPADGQMWVNATEKAVKVAYGGRVYRLPSYDDRSFVHASALSIASYVSFTLMLALGFGLCFQVPIVVVFLATTNLVTLGTLRRSRKYAILIIVIAAAIITPTPDWQTQLLLAVPMFALFELGLLAGSVALRMRARRDKKEGQVQSE